MVFVQIRVSIKLSKNLCLSKLKERGIYSEFKLHSYTIRISIQIELPAKVF